MHAQNLEHTLTPGQLVLVHLQQPKADPVHPSNAASLRLRLKPLLAQAAARHDLLLTLSARQYGPMWQLLAPAQAHWLCRCLLALQKMVERAQLRSALQSELCQLLHDAALARWAALPQEGQLDEGALLRGALQHLAVYANLSERALLQRLYLALTPRQQQRSRMASCLLAQLDEVLAALPYMTQARPAAALPAQEGSLLAQLAGWLSHAPASPQVERALRRGWVRTLLQRAPDALLEMLRELSGVHWQAALVACLDESQLTRLQALLLPPSGRVYLPPPHAALPQIERQLSWCRLLRRALQTEGELPLPRSQAASSQLRLLLRYGAWPASLSRSAGLNLHSWLTHLPDSLISRELALLGPAAARQLARLDDAAFHRRVVWLLLGEQGKAYQRVLDGLLAQLALAGLAGDNLRQAQQQALTLWLASLLVRGQARPTPAVLTQALQTALALRYGLPESALRLASPVAIVLASATPTEAVERPVSAWRGELPGEALARHHNVHVHC